jgi:hypothetical protein
MGYRYTSDPELPQRGVGAALIDVNDDVRRSQTSLVSRAPFRAVCGRLIPLSRYVITVQKVSVERP